MKKIIAQIISAVVALAASWNANADTIVDWGGNYVSANQGTQRGAGGAMYNFNSFVDGAGNCGISGSRPLSLSSQLNPTIGANYAGTGNNTEKFYGGVGVARLYSGSTPAGASTTAEVVDNGMSDRIHLAASTTEGNRNSEGAEVFFRKADFLNGYSLQTLSFNQAAARHIDSLTLHLVSSAVWTIKLAVVNAGTFYIANYNVTTGVNTLNSAALAAMTFQSANLVDGNYNNMGGPGLGSAVAGSTLNDVTALGLIAFTYNAGYGAHSADLVVERFSATAVIIESATAPSIDNTGGAVGIGTGNATLQGMLTSTGGAPTKVWAYWGPTDCTNNKTAWNTGLAYDGGSDVGEGALATAVGGLTPNTTYYYRYYASNSVNGVWAAPSQTFRTLGRPTVGNADGASQVQTSSATLNGTLTDTGGASTDVLVFFGQNGSAGTDKTLWTTNYPVGTSLVAPQSLSTNMTGLAENTTYYYRFYATNAFGDAWAPTVASFTTPAPATGSLLVRWAGDYVSADRGSQRGTTIYYGGAGSALYDGVNGCGCYGIPYATGTALSPIAGLNYHGVNATYYGGVALARLASGSPPDGVGCGATVVNNGLVDRIRLSVRNTDINYNASGAWVLWKKADFLRYASDTFGLGRNSSAPRHIDGICADIVNRTGSFEARFVVVNDSTVYVSTNTFTAAAGTFEFDAAALAATAWQSVSVGDGVFTLNGPAVGALGSPVASSELVDITAVGIMARGVDTSFAVLPDRILEISRFEVTYWMPSGTVLTIR